MTPADRVQRDSSFRAAYVFYEARRRDIVSGVFVAARIALAESSSELPIERWPREAAGFGVACGAAAVKTPGLGLCRRADADELFERMRRESES